ncbi:MAG: hypothetical protein F4X98_06545 [Gammaproteobacteria bacterium]|nr:hypothetical protein [Gammaproteobacteria bacterium]
MPGSQRRSWRRAALAVFALLAAGCGEAPPATEQDVLETLVRDVVVPMGKVVVISRASDCRQAKQALPAEVWTAFLEANAAGMDGLELDAHAARLVMDESGAPPSLIRARRRQPVVALSRIGVAGETALMCIEVYGAEDRGFYVLFGRDGTGKWSARAEFAAWSEAAEEWELEPEELPDGEIYER